LVSLGFIIRGGKSELSKGPSTEHKVLVTEQSVTNMRELSGERGAICV
jgi:hypothetical protein